PFVVRDDAELLGDASRLAAVRPRERDDLESRLAERRHLHARAPTGSDDSNPCHGRAFYNPPRMISFGTDGWRAIIADGFTFDNVRRVSEAIAVAARGLEPPPGVGRNAPAVGFAPRFPSREFAQ